MARQTTTEKTEPLTEVVNRARFYEVLGALLVTAVLVWFVYFLINPTTLPIRQVRIEGEFRHLSTAGLQELVRARVRGGFFNIDVKAVRDAVLTEPWVSSVSVHRVWPDGLQVFVNEQVAVAYWRDDGLVNRHGELFRPDKMTFPEGLPRLSGPDGTHDHMTQRYLELSEQLAETGLQLEELVMDERRAWSMRLANDLWVIIGRKDFQERISRFLEVIPPQLGERLHQARQIDMRYTNGFAVQWKEHLSEHSLAGGA